MQSLSAHKLGIAAVLLLIAALIGAGYAAILDSVIRSDLSLFSFLRGGLRGLMIGAIVLAFEYGLSQSRFGTLLRRAPFLASLGLRTLATTAVLMGAIILSRIVLSSRGHSLQQWMETGFLRDFAFVGFAAFLIHFTWQTIRIVGGRTLMYFLLGRYNKPVIEQRIFMLIDITGSTAIAQRLGDTRAHELTTRFFFDIAAPVSRFEGETELYVGDEVVISWPMGPPDANARCLLCHEAIRAVMAQNADKYRSEFGETIQVRTGIHGGTVAAGECGDNKRQVVFIGDTINVAKRLQEACKDYGQDVLISGDLLNRITLPEGFRSQALGTMVLRGRSTETQIHTISSPSARPEPQGR